MSIIQITIKIDFSVICLQVFFGGRGGERGEGEGGGEGEGEGEGGGVWNESCKCKSGQELKMEVGYQNLRIKLFIYVCV